MELPSRRLTRFYISIDLLIGLLNLPEGTQIIWIDSSSENVLWRDVIDMCVTYPELPEVIEGEVIPRIVPVWHVEYDEGNLVPDKKIVFDGWNPK